MTQLDLDLRETLEAYPGRLTGLSMAAGVPYTTLRRIRDGVGRRVPWDACRRLAAAPGWAQVPGVPAESPESVLAYLALLWIRAGAAK